LFLTSSVSGGSVGVRHLITHARHLATNTPWVKETAGLEALSPVVGWGLFHDLPAFMLGLKLDPSRCDAGESFDCRWNVDRAFVQETAVAGGKDGALEDAPERGVLDRRWPVTVFNVAENGAARRVLISRLALAPSPRRAETCPIATGEPINTAIDAHDVLGEQVDVPLVTAALLSARFPLVAPAGRLGTDTSLDVDHRGCEKPPLKSVTLRDGGYIENSGILTIAELLPAVQAAISDWAGTSKPRVWPIVVSIDDDPPKPNEVGFTDPPSGPLGVGKKAGSALLTAGARASVDNCAFPGVSYVRLSPTPRMGAQAATGWAISETTRDEDLGDSLRAGQAGRTLEVLRGVLKGTHTDLEPCEVTRPQEG
jgi:hypothetical protein